MRRSPQHATQQPRKKRSKYPPNYSQRETPHTEALLAFLRDYLASHPFAPSLNEMMAALGLCKSTTYYTLGKLMAQERVARARPRSPRALILLEPPNERASTRAQKSA